MLFCLISGCTGNTEAAESDSTGTAVSSIPATSESEASDDAVPAAAVTPATISYPLDGGKTLTSWATMKGTYEAAFSEWNQCYILDYAEKATGVKLDVTSISDKVASEQYSLMVASGDWPDIVSLSDYYTGGIAQGYKDDFIIELTDDMLAQNAPDYYSSLKALDEASQGAAKDGGKNLAMYNILDQVLVGSGLILRQDWLDAVGLKTPANLDEITDVLYAFYNKYSSDSTLRLYEKFDLTQFNAAFNTKCVGYSNTSLPVYIVDGKVLCSYATDEYRTYIEWLAKLYKDGIINKEFYLKANGGPDRFGDIVADKVGIWTDNAGTVNDWTKYTENPEQLDAEAFSNPVAEDETNSWGDEKIYVSSKGSMSITTNCTDPTLALEYMNYFYTDNGSLLANYGVEGTGYSLDSNGNVTLLEAITNNEYGLNPGGAISINSMLNLVSHNQYEKRLFSTLDDDAIEAYEIYNNSSITAEHYYPDGASLTSEESDSINSSVTSILTASEEQLLSFITNTTEINDETWGSFVSNLNDLGLENCVSVYQNAYDEYNTGKR